MKRGFKGLLAAVAIAASLLLVLLLFLSARLSRPEPPEVPPPTEPAPQREVEAPAFPPAPPLEAERQAGAVVPERQFTLESRAAPSIPSWADEEHLLEQMARGPVAFTTPSRMLQEETAIVQLVLDPTSTLEELQARLAEEGEAGEEVGGEVIRFSRVMEANLVGSGFDIEPITPGRQLVTLTEPTRWAWMIRATESGEQRLHLTLSATFRIEGTQQLRHLRTFEREIPVLVSWPRTIAGFIERHLQWIVPVILVPVFGALAAWWHRHRHRPPRAA